MENQIPETIQIQEPNLPKTNKPLMYLLASFALIIIILISIIIFRKPNDVVTIDKTKDKIQKDSINMLLYEISSYEDKINDLKIKYDSVTNIETHVITRTNEKVKFIYLTTNPTTLDSTIRENWDSKP